MQLFDAVVVGDLARIKKFVARPLNIDLLVHRPEVHGYFAQPALCALANGSCKADVEAQCEIAELLIKAGAKPDSLDSVGFSSLHHGECDAAVLRIFLSAKPNVNLKGLRGRAPLHNHASHGNTEQCQLLIAAKSNPNARTKESLRSCKLSKMASWP